MIPSLVNQSNREILRGHDSSRVRGRSINLRHTFWISKALHYQRRFRRRLLGFLAVLGPGIIVMVADNDAGGITTWFLILLDPVAYYVQEMTVRLGTVTKRGHAEAILSAFGHFWGWFSLVDLVLTDWLTMITEFIGMTAALSIFHISPVIAVVICWTIMGAMMLTGQYWTWEKIALLFCVINLIYVPAAFMVYPSVREIALNSVIPTSHPAGSPMSSSSFSGRTSGRRLRLGCSSSSKARLWIKDSANETLQSVKSIQPSAPC
jgi:hypothetical protein